MSSPREVHDLVTASVSVVQRLRDIGKELARGQAEGSPEKRLADSLEGTASTLAGYADKAEAALKDASPDRRAQTRLPRRAEDVLTAIVGGQLAGLAMGVMGTLLYSAVLGKSPLHPLQVIAATFLGDGALTRATPGTVLFAVLLHQLGPTLFWSALFGVTVSLMAVRPTLGEALMGGLLVGGLSEVFDVYLTMPFVQEARNGHNIWAEHVPLVWDWVAHVSFGLAVGGAYTWLTLLKKRRRDAARTPA